MITYLSQRRESWPFKLMSAVSSLTFLFTLILPPSVASAQQMSILNLPGPGSMVLPTAGFAPALMKGLKVHPENPLAFDFIIDTGDSKLTGAALDQETSKLVRYFLATLTTPEENLWVNLSPYEKDRIIPDKFGETEMGRDLLAQDYILKQLMASMMYPEDGLGKEFWKRVYDRAQKEFGTTNIPINTFNKIWIVPETANVVEYQGSAFVTNSHLKVMLEEDYLALAKNMDNKDFGIKGTPEPQVKDASAISSKVIKEVLIPEIEKEVNQGKNFAQLRQVYHSMILATWYKQALKESLLAKVYVDKSKIKGVDVDDKEIKQKIYAQYVEAFKKGVYNYIKKDIDPATQKAIPRKYFSGGFSAEKMNLGRRTLASPAALRAELGKIGVSSPTNSTIVSSAVQLTENPQEGDAVKQVADMRAERKAVITALDKVREDLGQRNSLFLNQPLPGQLNTVFYEKGAVSFVIHAMDEAQAEAVQITRRQDGQGIIFDVTVQNSRGTWQDLKNSVDKEVRKLTDEGRLEDPREIGVIISNLLYWWGQGGQAELKGTSTTPGDRAIRIKENLQMLLAEGAMDTWISRGEELVRKDWEELNGLSADSIPLSQSAQLIQVLLKMQEKAGEKGIILSSSANSLIAQSSPAGKVSDRFWTGLATQRQGLKDALDRLEKGVRYPHNEVNRIENIINWLSDPKNLENIVSNRNQAQTFFNQLVEIGKDYKHTLEKNVGLFVTFWDLARALESKANERGYRLFPAMEKESIFFMKDGNSSNDIAFGDALSRNGWRVSRPADARYFVMSISPDGKFDTYKGAIQNWRKRFHLIPVVVLIPSKSSEYAAEIFAAGVDSIITYEEGVDPQSLLRVLEDLPKFKGGLGEKFTVDYAPVSSPAGYRYTYDVVQALTKDLRAAYAENLAKKFLAEYKNAQSALRTDLSNKQIVVSVAPSTGSEVFINIVGGRLDGFIMLIDVPETATIADFVTALEKKLPEIPKPASSPVTAARENWLTYDLSQEGQALIQKTQEFLKGADEKATREVLMRTSEQIMGYMGSLANFDSLVNIKSTDAERVDHIKGFLTSQQRDFVAYLVGIGDLGTTDSDVLAQIAFRLMADKDQEMVRMIQQQGAGQSLLQSLSILAGRVEFLNEISFNFGDKFIGDKNPGGKRYNSAAPLFWQKLRELVWMTTRTSLNFDRYTEGGNEKNMLAWANKDGGEFSVGWSNGAKGNEIISALEKAGMPLPSKSSRTMLKNFSSSPAGVLESYASWANEFLQELQAKTAQGVLQETTSLREFWTEGNQATIRIPQVVYNEQKVQVVYKGSGNVSIMPVGEKTPLVEFKAPPTMTVKELMNVLKSWTLETSIPSSSPTEKVPLEEVWGKKIVVADPAPGIQDAMKLLLEDKGLLPENAVFVSTLSGAINAIEENIKANKEVVLVIASELLADKVDEKKIRGAGYQGTIVVLDRSRKNETLLRLNSMGVADYDVVQKFSMNEELFPDIRDVEFAVPVLPNNQDNDVFSSPSETGKKRVLVVDDEASIRDLLKEVLESWGYEVVLAIDGRDAVDKMGQGFDAVLTDNNMPNMDGIDFLRALRGQGNNVPVILTTGMASQELENETQKLGADFLEKPVGLTTLKMAVQKAIPSSPSVNDQDVGGINLDPSLLNLQIKRDKNWVPLPMSEQPPVESMNIDGFYPVIINTTPLPSLPMFLGMIGETPNTDGKTSGPEQLSWLGLSPFDQKARLEKEEIYS